jgi:hypothetical protein
MHPKPPVSYTDDLTRIHLVLFACIMAGTEHVTCSLRYTKAFQDLPPVISSGGPLQGSNCLVDLLLSRFH